MPDFLTSDTCTNSNGYFGCQGEFNNEGKPESHSMSQRHIHVPYTIGSKRETKKDYVWYEMGIFTSWNSKCHRVLCIDTPSDFPKQFKVILEKQASPLNLGDPFSMFAPLIDQIVKLSDESVWLFRPQIRYIEKVCFDLFCFQNE